MFVNLIERLNNKGDHLLQAGDYDEAWTCFQQAYFLRKKTEVQLNSLDSFGLAKRDDFLNTVLTEKPYEIQAFLENAIPIWEEYYHGPDHLETAHGHDQLAQLAANRGDPLTAETHWQQALPVFQIWLGVEHPITQQIHCALQEIKLA